jgi:hypothetical protein
MIYGTTTGSMGNLAGIADTVEALDANFPTPPVGLIPAGLLLYGWVKRKRIPRTIGLVWCGINLWQYVSKKP